MRISDWSSDVCSSDLATLQSPWLLGSFAALFLILASSLFGLFELRLPSALMNRLQSTGPTRSGGSVTGAAALGFLSALLVGPCMTAPLAGALLYIGQTGRDRKSTRLNSSH